MKNIDYVIGCLTIIIVIIVAPVIYINHWSMINQ